MAMTVTVTKPIKEKGQAHNKRVVLLTCTADATPATMAATLTAAQMAMLGNGYLENILTVPGGTGPTDNSDLAIADSRGHTIVGAASKGLNVIDNATVNSFLPETNGIGDGSQPVHSAYPWTITITNNGVANSSTLIYLEIREL